MLVIFLIARVSTAERDTEIILILFFQLHLLLLLLLSSLFVHSSSLIFFFFLLLVVYFFFFSLHNSKSHLHFMTTRNRISPYDLFPFVIHDISCIVFNYYVIALFQRNFMPFLCELHKLCAIKVFFVVAKIVSHIVEVDIYFYREN